MISQWLDSHMVKSYRKMNTDLHEYILQSLKDDIIRHAYIEGDQPSDLHLLRLIFKNYRHTSKNRRGLRLTYIGDRVMSGRFQSYSYETANKVSNKSILSLDKNMIWPYYIGKQHVTFYNQDDAAWFQLNGSDINTFTEYF
jgi:hypothetical protein